MRLTLRPTEHSFEDGLAQDGFISDSLTGWLVPHDFYQVELISIIHHELIKTLESCTYCIIYSTINIQKIHTIVRGPDGGPLAESPVLAGVPPTCISAIPTPGVTPGMVTILVVVISGLRSANLELIDGLVDGLPGLEGRSLLPIPALMRPGS